MGAAKNQLRRIIQLMAWLHAVLQQPVPAFVGSVVVPRAQRRKALRKLGHQLEERVAVPQGHGTAHVTWEVSLV